MKKKSVIAYLVITIGIIILVNLLSDKFFVRLDLTSDNRYTLSEATKDIMNNLSEPVTVTAYFSKDLPPNIAQTRRDFKDLLIEYASLSDGNLVYEFIDPNQSDKMEQKAMQAGVQPVIINTREKDQSVQKRAYLGAVIQMGDKKEVIPFMQPGAAMEYALSSSIKKLTVDNKPVIGLVQGQGEPAPGSLSQAMSELSVLYQVEPLQLTDSVDLSSYKTLAVIAPRDSFNTVQLNKLDAFLASGKNLLVAIDRVDGDLQNSRGTTLNTGLESWLKGKGITVDPDFVIDASCGAVTVMQQQGPFSFQTNVNFPYIPVVSKFARSPVTEGLDAIIFKFVSQVRFTGDSSLNYTPLIFSSEKSGIVPSPTYFNIEKKWSESDFTRSGITLGASLEGNISGNKSSKMIVFGDGDFPVGSQNRQKQQSVNEDNINLLVNAIDWLSDDTGLIQLRTKGVTARPLDQIADSKKTFLKYLNFSLPIVLVIVFGIIRMQFKKSLRIKRMEEGYV